MSEEKDLAFDGCSTYGIFGTMTIYRGISLSLIQLSRSISRVGCCSSHPDSWTSIKNFWCNLRKFKMLLNGIQVWLYFFSPSVGILLVSWRCPSVFGVGEKFVGYCYLDLFPRGMRFSLLTSYVEAKHSHTAVWPLLAGYDLPNNKRHYLLAAMVANWRNPL